jgi:error-prone DNA polymerase
MNPEERLQADYETQHLTTGPHPMYYLRDRLPDLWRATDLGAARDGEHLVVGGLVICRQRPGTAKGHVFLSLEDETGVSNAIVAPLLFEKYRLVVTQESFLKISGVMQNTGNSQLLKTERIEALHYRELTAPQSHDFH